MRRKIVHTPARSLTAEAIGGAVVVYCVERRRHFSGYLTDFTQDVERHRTVLYLDGRRCEVQNVAVVVTDTIGLEP